MEIKKIDINLLKPNNYNPNKIENGKLKCLRDKIIKDGYLQPILVRKKDDYYEIIDGYHRWLCCKEAGYTEIECVIVDVNDRNAKLLTLAMNNLRGSPEEDLLKKVIEDLENDMDLTEICLETGFSKKELEKLFKTEEIKEIEVNPTYEVVITCKDEIEQMEVFEKLKAEGYNCRVLIL
ncbi:ParB-like nuclease domain-containing protein [bacterium]|nr:ParB-like nuclease domain-containing protein [bacterium]